VDASGIASLTIEPDHLNCTITFFSTAPNTLEVSLVTIGSDLPPGTVGTFDIEVNGIVAAVDTGTTHTFDDVGAFEFGATIEDPGPAWELVAISCDEVAGGSDGVDLATRSVNAGFSHGSSIGVCTFTLTPSPRGSIDATVVIEVVTEPADVGVVDTFEFEIDGSLLEVPANGSNSMTGAFGEDDPVTPPDPAPFADDTPVVRLLDAGLPIHMVDPGPGYELQTIGCSNEPDGSSNLLAADIGDRSAILDIQPLETVTCIFNLLDLTISATATIEVVADPPNAQGTFSFDIDPDRRIQVEQFIVEVDANESHPISGLASGSYPIELLGPPPGWQLVSIDCDDPGSGTPSVRVALTGTAMFSLDPGEEVTCQFILRNPSATTSDSSPAPTAADPSQEPQNADPSSEPSAADPSTEPTTISQPSEPDPDDVEFPPPSADEQPTDDAGPLPGRWRIRNTESSADCSILKGKIDNSPRQTGRLQVRQNGRRLIGSGFSEGQRGRVTLDADDRIEGRYNGRMRIKFRGGRADVRLTWQVITERRMIGTNKMTARLAGQTCTITRDFVMTYQGGN